MGLKSIVNSIFRTGPLWSIRRKLNIKVDNKLNEFIQPVNSAVCETKELQHNAIRLIHDSWNLAVVNHNQVIANQDNAFYHSWFSLVYPSFTQTLVRIAGDDYQDIVPYSHLLLMEIARSYLRQGGLWQLDYEIARFKSTANPQSAQNHPLGSENRNRMKILVVSGMFPSIDHGGGLRLFDIISELGGNHDIDLFSIYTPKIDEYSRTLLAGLLGKIKLVEEQAFSSEALIPWLAEIGRTPGYYDVIQCEYPLSVKLVDVVRPFGRKVGFTFMECITKSYLIKLRNAISDKEFSNMGRLVQSFWEFAVEEFNGARDTDFQIAVTPEDADFIEAVSGIRPELVPTCLSPSQVLSRIEACQDVVPDADTVVFLGYFNHFPNIDGMKWYLRYVHPEVKKRVPSCRFLVVGAGDISVLQELTCGDASVVYTGRVDDITPYIMKGKVCVLPLISGAGIRGKLNQYSIAGRPSVSTTIGNLGLNYQDGEAVIVADTPEAFADAVVRLLTDDAANRSIAVKAQAYAQANFTWESHIAHLLEIYRA
ncbi:MAG: glycosyltransferase [Desulfobulbaceae bacterium]|nr:glycosyltransferase [Desulfobulbaceae bacterium]